MTIMIVIFSEVTPKIFAINRPMLYALKVARFFYIYTKLIKPIVKLINYISEKIIKNLVLALKPINQRLLKKNLRVQFSFKDNYQKREKMKQNI